ncbi:hypothetical protein CK203_092859 [Vitis vinifera]|uniref:Uncharacterized protein n=1 Tax=Vitis vinifera TaxID=29760 RepID=A0A438E2R7_VITVI|nr:hypothetical protein CK203_092859 [Vitis vinifera]
MKISCGLRMEEAEANLSTMREENEALRAELAEVKSREESTAGRLHEAEGEAARLRDEVSQLRTEVSNEKKQKEDLQLRLDVQKEELEREFCCGKGGTCSGLPAAVDDTFIFGYRCCMKKNGIKRDTPSIPPGEEKKLYEKPASLIVISFAIFLLYDDLGNSKAANNVLPYEFGAAGRVPLCPCPLREGHGPETDFNAADGTCGMERIFDIYHIFGHMLPRSSSLLANSILVNELYVLGIVLPYDFRIFLHVIQLAHIGPLNAKTAKIRPYEGSFVQVPPNQGETGSLDPDFVRLCRIFSKMASLIGGDSYPAKASACLLSARLIFSIVHSVNCCKVLLTLAKYPPCSKGEVQSGQDASYSASLLDAENPSWMACSRCSPVGDCSKSPLQSLMSVRLRQLVVSTTPVHLIRGAGWVFVNIRARSRPLLGLFWIIWVGIRFQIRSIRWPIVAFAQLNLVCAECYEGVGRSVQSLGGLENRGGAFGQHFEELRLLAPFLNTWFLHLPMPC